MRKYAWAMIVWALGFAGCGGPALPPEPDALARRPAFRETEMFPYKGEATATVTGQAFAVTRGGRVIPAAGRPVCLIPSTSVGLWANYKCARTSAATCDLLDEGTHRYTRFTTADAQGNFKFENVPTVSKSGYIVMSDVQWDVVGHVGRYGPDYETQRVCLTGSVTTEPGKTTNVIAQ